MTPKQIRARTVIIQGIGLLIGLRGIASDEHISLIIIGILIMISSIIHHIMFYRCPHCGKFLDRSTGDFCPGCGKEVNKFE